MDARDVLKQGFARAEMIMQMMLGDLEDQHMTLRPVPGANHIAWQMGHLIGADNSFGEMLRPGSMPPLPEGFQEQHSKEMADKDDGFSSKDTYLKLLGEQRQALIKLMEELPDQEMEKPAPEALASICPRVIDVFGLAVDHEMMHSGQFSSVRRTAGKPRAF